LRAKAVSGDVIQMMRGVRSGEVAVLMFDAQCGCDGGGCKVDSESRQDARFELSSAFRTKSSRRNTKSSSEEDSQRTVVVMYSRGTWRVAH
jgi:hypothetical protein